MGNQWFFVAKLFLLSGLIAVAIKYLLPLLNIPATATVVLGLVLTPPTLLAALLAWRQVQSSQNPIDSPKPLTPP
jgi:hypothetical protein